MPLSRARNSIPKEIRPVLAILSGMEAGMLKESGGHEETTETRHRIRSVMTG
jgi:hypothetical protein